MQIVKSPSAVLNQVSAEVTEITPRVKKIAKGLMETLKGQRNGVGLAAVQVGRPIRMFAFDHESIGRGVILNPVVETSGERTTEPEGCLSQPGVFYEVPRGNFAKVTGQNIHGETIEMDVVGFTARILQHEQDHLDGKCIFDRMDMDDPDSVAHGDKVHDVYRG